MHKEVISLVINSVKITFFNFPHKLGNSIDFNEKLFHEQLCYFEDIDYLEPIAFIGEENSEDHKVREAFT